MGGGALFLEVMATVIKGDVGVRSCGAAQVVGGVKWWLQGTGGKREGEARGSICLALMDILTCQKQVKVNIFIPFHSYLLKHKIN